MRRKRLVTLSRYHPWPIMWASSCLFYLPSNHVATLRQNLHFFLCVLLYLLLFSFVFVSLVYLLCYNSVQTGSYTFLKMHLITQQLAAPFTCSLWVLPVYIPSSRNQHWKKLAGDSDLVMVPPRHAGALGHGIWATSFWSVSYMCLDLELEMELEMSKLAQRCFHDLSIVDCFQIMQCVYIL